VAEHRKLLPILIALLGFHLTAGWGTAQRNDLPEGQNGIASEYPGDRGIGKADDVVFVEAFEERNLNALVQRWESARGENTNQLILSEQQAPDSAGDQSLLMKHIGGKSNTIDLYRRLKNEKGRFGHDRLFCRMYVKFAKNCYSVHHFGTHLGGYNPPTPYPQGGAGVRPDGDDRFTVQVEPRGETGEPWNWAWYNYWSEMRGSPPEGKTWGNSFMAPDQRPTVTRGSWQCIEIMIDLNDVGTRNGQIALWVDGQLVSYLGEGFPRGTWIWDSFHPGRKGNGVTWDGGRKKIPGNRPFDGFRWRTDADLKISHLWPYVYITKAPDGYVSKVWFDQIVVARQYIGPIRTP